MAVLSWILSLLCAAGCHRSSASPVLRSAQGVQVVQVVQGVQGVQGVQVVQVGQNVTLTCDLTSSQEVTWYRLRSGSDQLLPLLTLSFSKLGDQVVDYHSENISHMSSGGGGGGQEAGPVTLEIMAVEEQDQGMYFCSARCSGVLRFNRATLLSVGGADGTSAAETGRPCWSVGICVLPAALVFVFVLVLILFLCSGKPAVCSCRSGSRAAAPRVTEDDSLHYSSLKHVDRPRPPGRRPPRLVEKDDTYSAVRVAKTQRDHMTADRGFHCHLLVTQ